MGDKMTVTVSMKKVWRVQTLTQALRVAYRALAKDLAALEEIREAQAEAKRALDAVEMDEDVSSTILRVRRWEDAVTAGRHVRFSSRGAQIFEGGEA
ncbi:MAG TPA: hypothetical protein ENJ54_04190 [Chloroflexi bacterium]|nr:hypothetical protein [Chloroflexota bacterium]